MAAKEGKMNASFKLVRAAWRTLMLDKELVGLSVLAMALQMVIFAAFIVVGIFVMPQVFVDTSENGVWDWRYYVLLAVYFLSVYLVANVFNGAISHAALQRFRGSDPTFGSALAASRQKFGVLFQFTALQATVGLVLNILAERLPFAGKIATALTGAAWNVATMFALPVIMDNRETKPFAVVKTSAKTFLAVWAESVFIGLSLGAISVAVSVLLMAVMLGFLGYGFASESGVFIGIGLIVLVVWMLAVVIFSLVLSALKQIVMTAAYYYATTQQIPAGFDEELVRSMFKPKKKWLA